MYIQFLFSKNHTQQANIDRKMVTGAQTLVHILTIMYIQKQQLINVSQVYTIVKRSAQVVELENA